MTLKEVFQTCIAILEQRLQAQPKAQESFQQRVDALKSVKVLDETVRDEVQFLMNSVPGVGGPAEMTGACTYDINGTPFCLDGLNTTECDRLHGTLDTSQNARCSLPPWPPQHIPGPQGS